MRLSFPSLTDMCFFLFSCNTTCPARKFGENCEEYCTCTTNAVCHFVDGSCLCNSGWIGGDCSEQCSSGFYGDQCKQTCDCQNNAFCSHIDGSCNCTAGWRGTKCNLTCQVRNNEKPTIL